MRDEPNRIERYIKVQVAAWEVEAVPAGGLCADLDGSTGLGWGEREHSVPQSRLF